MGKHQIDSNEWFEIQYAIKDILEAVKEYGLPDEKGTCEIHVGDGEESKLIWLDAGQLSALKKAVDTEWEDI